MIMEHKPRKNIRLKEHDYNSAGSYFITFCVQNKKKILSHIHVGALHEAPEIELTQYGKAVKDVIETVEKRFGVTVDRYIIMPNHIHLIIIVNENGRSGAPAPTPANARVPRYVSTLKRFVNKECKCDIWQRSYYDHIIRNEADYLEKSDYIINNPAKWVEDEYFTEG